MTGIFRSPNPPVPSEAFREVSFVDFLFNTNCKYSPNTPAYVDGVTGDVANRGDFEKECLLLASAFQNAGRKGLAELGRGGTVCVFSPNSLLYPKVMFALGAAGICGAYANSTYVGDELAHAYKTSKSSHMVVHPALLRVAITTLKSIGFSEESVRQRVILMSYKKDVPQEIAAERWIDIDDVVAGNVPLSKPEEFYGVETHETAAIFFSSGTTGLSKAVALSHWNIISLLVTSGAYWPYYQHGRDVMMCVIPIFHSFGGIILIMHGYHTGIPVVILPRFEPDLFLSSIQKFKITALSIVPPLLNFLCKHPLVAKYDISSVKMILVGAAPVAPAALSQTVELFAKRGVDIKISQGYGLTETSGSLSFLPVEYMSTKSGSIGYLLPNIEGRLVNDEGKDVPVGEPGELWARGPNIMKEYFGNPKATQETFAPDGWFKTGDIMIRDADGFLTVVDRKKELIKYKGFQVAPAELEALLFTHPLVADVGVIGVYSEKEFSEVPLAYIVPKDVTLLKSAQKDQTAQDIQEWVKGKVAPYKRLRGGIVLVEAIPRSASGKILRKDLRVLHKSSEDGKARL